MHESRAPSGLDEPSYSVSEFAGVLGVHRTTVRRWVNRGLLPHWLTLGGHARIPKSAAAASVPIRSAPDALDGDPRLTAAA